MRQKFSHSLLPFFSGLPTSMAAVLSPDERTWLAGGFAHVRADGRGPADARPVAAAAGVLPAAAGSAEVRLGGTHVIVGVKVSCCVGGMGREKARSDRACKWPTLTAPLPCPP